MIPWCVGLPGFDTERGNQPMLPRILIVEDDTAFREIVCEVLRNAGYRVKGARSLEKAAKRLSKHKFDLVLTDVHSGQESGFEVLQVTRHTRPDAKIILMSGHGNPEIVQQALNSGAARFLSKPFRVSELLQAVQELLGDVS